MNLLSLPDPISAYFAADAKGSDVLADCFTTNATVTDEGRTHHGLAAIRAWKAAASADFSYKVEPLAVEHSSGLYTVTGRVTGSFPGSPLDLRYRFSLEGGLVASLEIAP